MFEMEYPVHKMESAADNSICVFCSQDEKHQFLELSLPSKLTTQLNNRSDTTITSDTDLKIRCGTFTTLGVSCVSIGFNMIIVCGCKKQTLYYLCK